MEHNAKILFPTEFGPLGEKAEKNAIHLANLYDAELVLMHAVNIPHGISALFSDVSEEEVRKRAQKALDKYAEKMRNMGALKVSTIVRAGGKPEVAIVEAAKELNATLVIFGTKGGSGLRDTLLGSAVNYVIRNTPCPVLTIRNLPDHVGFNSVLIPIDLSMETGEVVQYGVRMAKLHDAKAHIYALDEKTGKDQKRLTDRIQASRDYAAEQGVEIDVTTEEVSGNAADSFLDYADKISADLICVLTQSQSSAALGQIADRITNVSQRPVVSIRPEREYHVRAWKSHHFT